MYRGCEEVLRTRLAPVAVPVADCYSVLGVIVRESLLQPWAGKSELSPRPLGDARFVLLRIMGGFMKACASEGCYSY